MGVLSEPVAWIVSPVYRDTEAYLVLYGRLGEVRRGEGPLSGYDLRFVVLDDSAGHDPEIDTLRDLPDAQVVTPPFNLGHQRGIVYAIRKIAGSVSDGDVVVTMDADGEDQPEDLPRMLSALSADSRLAAVLARRTRRRVSLRFQVMYLAFRVLFALLTGLSIKTGNYAVWRGSEARRAINHPSFDLCYSATLVSLDLPVAYVPCERGARYAGRSRMDVSRLALHGLRMLMPFTDRIAIRALALFSFSFAVAVALAMLVLAIRLFTSLAIPGWATTTLLLVLLLSFIALGNFVVLLNVYGQSRSLSLANLEQFNGRTGTPRSPAD